ncbi:unnamed protein product [Acanthocheilonema viteae]|uniref:Uncharacterized protein n=1 Tax=Acanthocheilonema viteae TaxID=6277 RepID=A0A498SXP1_ACAVI|nr:unnamed protein product [Acanthocheilonema viteae]
MDQITRKRFVSFFNNACKMYCLRNAPKAEEITNGTCFDPERNSYYTPKFGFCVYGINYEVNDDAVTFDEKLYFNYDQLFNDGDMTVDEFETAAKPLCDKIPYDDITKYVTYYYGAWVKTKNNTYKDMFIGCCKLCQMLSSINWLITLKIQMMALSKFALIRKDVLLYQKKMISFFDTNYLTAEYNRIPPCESSNYDLIPVLLGNPIGFASGFDRLSWESLLLRSIAPHREPVTYIGRYTSAIANEYKQNHCLNSYALKPYSVCLVYLLLTKEYGYECCCYGDEIPQCQERIRNAIIIGPSVGVFRRRKTPCVIDEDSLDHNSKFCELHLKFNGTEQINVSFNSNFTKQRLSLLYQQASKITERITISLVNKSYREQQSTSNQSIFWSINNMKDYDSERAKDYYKKLIEQSINITNSFQCVNLSNWDARAHDILQFNCAQLLPIDAQCPFSSSRNLEHQHIMCCCGHRSFCNYNADMIKRASAKSFPDLCEYNNEYQYFLHDYFYPTKLDANHSCLLHFVSGNALNDMSQLFSKENSIIFFLPGSAIQPIDFSYALLKPNECDYLDVDLKHDYLRTRYCYESTKLLKYFETEFMPMRLFACRCETTPGEARCDSILKQNIAEKAKNSKRKYYCAVYSDQHSVKFNYKPKFKVNDLSPYCATMLDFRTIGDS